ncbi:MAG: DinB family protein [Flavobacteriaceae bacterium]|nr:DinB family protein [Flavobacteriaceae bacterium]
MNHLDIVNKLSHNKQVYDSLLSQIDHEQIYWRPAPNKWNLLGIVCHLYDEEREDFRARVDHVLHTPNEEMPAIDPVLWVEERNYAAKNYYDILEKFLIEREQSISWLKSLDHPKWDNYNAHPKLGNISAFLLLANWLAHDYLHMRQINRYNYLFLKENTTIDLQYAGNW